LSVLILGPPGGGKGTVSKKLVKAYDFMHVSTGDLLRREAASGTALGREVQAVSASGGLVSDEIVMSIVARQLEEAKAAGRHILLDGVPRNLAQAADLEQRAVHIDLAVHVRVPFEAIVARLANRWTHLPSGRVYHPEYNPEKQRGLDDETGEPLIIREDDKRENVLARLDTYSLHTEPLIEFYQSRDCLVDLDGSDFPELIATDRRSDAIFKSLCPRLDQLFSGAV
jgi:adenylate kinase